MTCFTELIPEAVFTVDDVLTGAECSELIDWCEAQGFGTAPITTPVGFVNAPSVRNNTRVMVDHPQLAELLWERMRNADLPELGGWHPIGLNERFRIYRYEPGQYFKPHRDGWYARSSTEKSFWTLMIYLNDDFDGGETAFSDFAVAPQQGMALGFLHRLRHEGRTVTAGRKYAIRTDVMYRRA